MEDDRKGARRIETRARRGEKGRVVRGEGDIGDARSVGPRGKGNNRSGGGNEEIGRHQGREDKREHMMQDAREDTKKSSKKIIEDHEGGGVVRDGECRPLSGGSGRREIPPTHLRGAFLWNLDTQPE
jgi:hypothetical protein